MTVSRAYDQLNTLSGKDAECLTLDPPPVPEDHPYESLDMIVLPSNRALQHLGQPTNGADESPYASIDEVETNA